MLAQYHVTLATLNNPNCDDFQTNKYKNSKQNKTGLAIPKQTTNMTGEALMHMLKLLSEFLHSIKNVSGAGTVLENI